jgi:FMN-dependent NADH-azoreductase
MRLLNIVTSPRRERSASIAVIDSFLLEYQKRIKGVVVDTLDVWTESLPEFDAEAIGAKYKGVSGEAMTSSERATWEKIRELASGLTLSKGRPHRSWRSDVEFFLSL